MKFEPFSKIVSYRKPKKTHFGNRTWTKMYCEVSHRVIIGEKKQIIEFMKANPNEKLTNVAKIFTERLVKAGITFSGRGLFRTMFKYF